jgi:ABC-type dipeptide/oligopeptide/nickel transport system permease subunit
MLKRARSSRAWRKFRSSRSAVIAMWIIGAYLLLSVWIWGVEIAQSVGKPRGWWDLSQTRVVGLLLPERVLERVGPRWLAGFGLEQDTARREDQADFLFKTADDAITAAGRLAPGSDTTPAQVLARASLAERRLVDVPMDQLVARRDAAKAEFDRYDALKSQYAGVQKLGRSLDALESKAAATPGEDAKRSSDDLAAAVEEVLFNAEDALKTAGSEKPAWAEKLAAVDLDALQRAADAARDGAGAGALNDAQVELAKVRAAVGEADGAQASITSQLAKVEAAVGELMPIPAGFDGALYRVRIALGTDAQGRSILLRGLYSAKIAVQVGIVVALVSVLFGALVGAAAAYYGGWVDHAVIWLYSSLSSLPQLVLLAVLAFMFLGTDWERTLVPVYAALCLTFWIGPCRVIRGEVMKIKELEYAQAAKVIGFGRLYILLRHVLPNTAHLMFINFSLLFIGAVKSEVILTFLGLGIKEGSSWGLMISQSAPEVINGIFWQIGAATVLMLVLVLAFNVLSDALQDAFDPKHVG